MRFEIWMGEGYTYFNHGVVHFGDGRTLPLRIWFDGPILGLPVSLLLATNEWQVIPNWLVRWFILPDGIEIYHWDQDVTSIVLHNNTGADVTVKGYGVLSAGESRVYTKEG